MLPGYEIKNALIDFSPVTNAIESNQQNALARRRADNEDQRLGMERERLSMAKAESAEQAQMRKVQRWGAIANTIDAMPDGPQKLSAIQQFHSSNPDLIQHAQKSGLDPAHPQFMRFIAAESGKFDPMQRKLQEAQISNLNRREEPDIVRTLLAAGYKRGTPEFQEALKSTVKGQDPLTQAKIGVLNQLGLMPQGQSAAPQGGFQRQSNTTNPVPGVQMTPVSDPGYGDPNVIPVQGGQPAAPQQGLGGVMQGLTPQQRAGVGLGILGMGDAGKIIAESGNQGALGKEGINHVDKALVDRVMDLGDLDQIKGAFKPEYLGLEGQAKAFGAKWTDWLASGKIDPQSKQFLTGYSQFATATTERLNNRIKAMSGAAVSESEAKRMFAANPTTSDGPTEFKAKLDQQIDMNRMAVARYNWLRTQYRGTPEQIAELAKSGRIEAVPLGDMKKIYSDRSSQIEQQLRQQNPQASPQQIDQARRAKLRGEFGI